mmetsp:Transcript_10633/g.31100  ORF Transcript_10633/g.31100 Transcript_10633/m.31100 type:complete len:520 (-) Transcript_10633:297-1856(-)
MQNDAHMRHVAHMCMWHVPAAGARRCLAGQVRLSANAAYTSTISFRRRSPPRAPALQRARAARAHLDVCRRLRRGQRRLDLPQPRRVRLPGEAEPQPGERPDVLGEGAEVLLVQPRGALEAALLGEQRGVRLARRHQVAGGLVVRHRVVPCDGVCERGPARLEAALAVGELRLEHRSCDRAGVLRDRRVVLPPRVLLRPARRYVSLRAEGQGAAETKEEGAREVELRVLGQGQREELLPEPKPHEHLSERRTPLEVSSTRSSQPPKATPPSAVWPSTTRRRPAASGSRRGAPRRGRSRSGLRRRGRRPCCRRAWQPKRGTPCCAPRSRSRSRSAAARVRAAASRQRWPPCSPASLQSSRRPGCRGARACAAGGPRRWRRFGAAPQRRASGTAPWAPSRRGVREGGRGTGAPDLPPARARAAPWHGRPPGSAPGPPRTAPMGRGTSRRRRRAPARLRLPHSSASRREPASRRHRRPCAAPRSASLATRTAGPTRRPDLARAEGSRRSAPPPPAREHRRQP